ncbi:MAG TPA: biotin/lipoyl-binding protein, partial [Xanthobacteraceae bacterium]|nr:biotin/lipoyl-binding protein [Xanthobacteraceae bacterium]
MAETVLKFSPQQEAKAAHRARTLLGFLRARARLILLIIVPAIALIAGTTFYLMGGRYISTDNAYVGAQKVLITPDISGKVSRVLVHEGEHVAAGDPLIEIDPVPFRLALQGAESKLASVRTDFANLKSNYASLKTLVDLGKDAADLKRRDVDRKATLAESRAGSQVDLDNSKSALLTS